MRSENASERIMKAIHAGALHGTTGMKSCRKRARLSQEEAAELCECSVGTWREWEHGRHWPNAVRLPQIAVILGCRIEELYLGVQEEPGK